MNTTTSLPLTSLSMNCSMPMDPDPLCAGPSSASPAVVAAPICSAATGPRPGAATSPLRDPGLERQRVERAAHLPLQGLVEQLMLLHPRLAARVATGGLGVGSAALHEPLVLAGMHRHGAAGS